MTIVSIESSARPPSLAVRNGEFEASQTLEEGRRHASDLLPALDLLLGEIRSNRDEIDAVIVGTGPGSYTGLRVGIATALGLAMGTAAALQAVPSVEALAHEALEPGETGATLLDARSEQLYFALYQRDTESVNTLAQPQTTTAEELPSLLPPDAVIICDQAAALAAGLSPDLRARVRSGHSPSARTILELGSRKLALEGPLNASQVEPLYLRPFAAKIRRR